MDWFNPPAWVGFACAPKVRIIAVGVVVVRWRPRSSKPVVGA